MTTKKKTTDQATHRQIILRFISKEQERLKTNAKVRMPVIFRTKTKIQETGQSRIVNTGKYVSDQRTIAQKTHVNSKANKFIDWCSEKGLNNFDDVITARGTVEGERKRKDAEKLQKVKREAKKKNHNADILITSVIEALFGPFPPTREQMEKLRDMHRNGDLTQSQINLLNAAKFQWVSVEEGVQKLIDFNATTKGWDMSKAEDPREMINIANNIREKKKKDGLTHIQERLLSNISFNWSPLPNDPTTSLDHRASNKRNTPSTPTSLSNSIHSPMESSLHPSSTRIASSDTETESESEEKHTSELDSTSNKSPTPSDSEREFEYNSPAKSPSTPSDSSEKEFEYNSPCKSPSTPFETENKFECGSASKPSTPIDSEKVPSTGRIATKLLYNDIDNVPREAIQKSFNALCLDVSVSTHKTTAPCVLCNAGISKHFCTKEIDDGSVLWNENKICGIVFCCECAEKCESESMNRCPFHNEKSSMFMNKKISSISRKSSFQLTFIFTEDDIDQWERANNRQKLKDLYEKHCGAGPAGRKRNKTLALALRDMIQGRG